MRLDTLRNKAERVGHFRKIVDANPRLCKVLAPKLTKYIPRIPTPKQLAFLSLNHIIEGFYGGAASGGKAQPLSATLWTPWGPKKMGDVRVGDTLCSPAGGQTKVIQLHPQGSQDVYEVEFVDGAKVCVTKDHRWLARLARSRQHWKVWTTEQIKDTVESGRRVHVPLPKPVSFVGRQGGGCRYQLLDPYVLGVLLGDGTIKGTNRQVGFCSVDAELVQEVTKRTPGFSWLIHKGVSTCHGYVARQLIAPLKKLELYGHGAESKFIPKCYKFAPVDTRWQVLQGLMDTDGYVGDDGKIEFCSVSKTLAVDVQFLVESLGGVATLSSGIGSYRDSEGDKVICGTKYTLRIKMQRPHQLFLLSRKRNRALKKEYRFNARVIKSVTKVGREKCQCITVDHRSGLYLTDRFVVTHNSEALLMAALQYVDVPGYAALLLRRTFRELSLPSALMDRSRQWLAKTDAQWQPSKVTWQFPSGSSLTFGYLQHESDVYQYDSAEFQFIGFDELTQFSEQQYRFMFSRLRKKKDMPVPLRIRGASNPGGVGHLWVKERLIKGANAAKGRFFIPALKEDNPHVDQESYDRALDVLDEVTKRQRKYGDWDAEYQGTLFKRFWFSKFLDESPVDLFRCRFWDFAASQGKGDWTVGTKLGLDGDGRTVVEDVVRGQWGPHQVEKILKQTAELDGHDVMIRLEQEPGASGKTVVENYIRLLVGFDVKAVSATGPKAARWIPLAAQAEAGNVILLSRPWNSVWVDEMCGVPGTKHDDQADSAAGAFNELAKTPVSEYGIEFLR